MTRLALLLTAGSVLCAASPASAAILLYTGTLSGSQEVPGSGSPGTGNALITVDNVANTVRVQLTFSGLIGTTVASHIHCCALPGGSAGVATQTPTFANFPLGVTSGTYDQTFDFTLASSFNPAFITANGNSVTTARTTLFNGLANGLAYINVHTSTNPAGEIRGQLSAVPEPASWMLMLVGFGMAGWSIRRRLQDVRVVPAG